MAACSPRGFRFPKPPVPDSVRQSLEIAFKEIDTKSDGRIDEDELLLGLKKNGYTFTKRVIRRMLMFQLYQAEEVEKKTLNFDQFVSLSAFLAMMKEAFEKLDRDHNGFINDKELGAGLLDLGLRVTGEQIKLLMAIVDTDHSETVKFAEYVDLTFYLVFFSYITRSLSSRNIESFPPEAVADLCSLAGVSITLEAVKEFIEKNKGRPATFNDFLGLLVMSQVKSKKKN
mmetsp:Transcript_38839/g.54161  ORF Transcript_38839/g.54161 Transcript_38839/m.54161 type:complete len:229 (+) Transcript_38839:304-990(+)